LHYSNIEKRSGMFASLSSFSAILTLRTFADIFDKFISESPSIHETFKKLHVTIWSRDTDSDMIGFLSLMGDALEYLSLNFWDGNADELITHCFQGILRCRQLTSLYMS